MNLINLIFKSRSAPFFFFEELVMSIFLHSLATTPWLTTNAFRSCFEALHPTNGNDIDILFDTNCNQSDTFAANFASNACVACKSFFYKYTWSSLYHALEI